tara:strand:+ start:8563 stop:8700 length:138 start_codon:yes stop_codon:yes gene_type:complete
MGSSIIIEFPYRISDFDNKEELWSYMAISALMAGVDVEDIIVAYA